MRRYRLPATLLNGRLRTSALLLSLLFLAVLTLYLEVRPAPVGTTSSSDGSRQAEPSQPTASVPATTSATSAATSTPEPTATGAPTTSAARPPDHQHTDGSADIDHSEDHRELGDRWKPDHLA